MTKKIYALLFTTILSSGNLFAADDPTFTSPDTRRTVAKLKADVSTPGLEATAAAQFSADIFSPDTAGKLTKAQVTRARGTRDEEIARLEQASKERALARHIAKKTAAAEERNQERLDELNAKIEALSLALATNEAGAKDTNVKLRELSGRITKLLQEKAAMQAKAQEDRAALELAKEKALGELEASQKAALAALEESKTRELTELRDATAAERIALELKLATERAELEAKIAKAAQARQAILDQYLAGVAEYEAKVKRNREETQQLIEQRETLTKEREDQRVHIRGLEAQLAKVEGFLTTALTKAATAVVTDGSAAPTTAGGAEDDEIADADF